jgi:hypothetical protein
LQAQDTTKGVPPGAPLELFFGKKYVQQSFYNQLGTLAKPDLVSPLNCVGLGGSGDFILTRGGSYSGHFFLVYIVPQPIKIDSIEGGKISGCIFSASLFGWELLKNQKHVHCIVSGGINLGRLRILGSDMLHQKNAQFAPMAALQPYFYIGKMKLGLNLQYDYDVSKTRWKRTWFAPKQYQHSIAPLRQTGASAFFCVGWNLSE